MPDRFIKIWRKRWELKDDKPIRSFCKWMSHEIAEHLRELRQIELPKNMEEIDMTEAELISLQLNLFESELVTLKVLRDDPIKLVRVETEIARLRKRYHKISNKALTDE